MSATDFGGRLWRAGGNSVDVLIAATDVLAERLDAFDQRTLDASYLGISLPCDEWAAWAHDLSEYAAIQTRLDEIFADMEHAAAESRKGGR